LNKCFRSDAAVHALKIDGYCGIQTIQSITNFQRKYLNSIHPDGRVDPAGKTFQKLLSQAPLPPPPYTADFIKRFSDSAKAAATKWKVPTSVLLAQAAHESGWGKHIKGNAYFGIKGQSIHGSSVDFATTEVIDGKTISIKDTFRAYQDFAESADDYGRFLSENPRYKKCFEHQKDPYQFVKALAAAGYATDPNYSTKISNIIRGYELTKYDR
jgi:flagellum-specific peptidoglycan hydrolase FlgJ